MPETVRLMAGMLAGREPLTAVTAAPPLLYNYSPPRKGDSLDRWSVLIPAGAYGASMRESLAAAGVQLEERSPQLAWGPLRGTAAAARIDPNTQATAVEVPVVDYFVEAAP
jgi:hypothetical protein